MNNFEFMSSWQKADYCQEKWFCTFCLTFKNERVYIKLWKKFYSKCEKCVVSSFKKDEDLIVLNDFRRKLQAFIFCRDKRIFTIIDYLLIYKKMYNVSKY